MGTHNLKMGACLEKLPFELIQLTVYELGVLSPADVGALCQTCRRERV